MGLFDLFKKKDVQFKKENTDLNNTEKTYDNASSVIWLPKIYNQFKDISNIDRVYGERIPALILNYKSLYNTHASEDDIHNAFGALMNEVIRTLYIVPFHYDDANEFPNDTVIHCTPKAANKFNIESIIYRCQNMTMEEMSKLAWVKDPNTNILTVDLNWWDISRLSGCDGFRFEEKTMPGTMHPQIGNDGNNAFFLCFTGLDQYLKVYGQDSTMHIGLFTINDIVEYMASSEKIRGLIINPDTETHCFIGKDVF